jgi:ligand-binding SRPBCC domain-containing protein
MYTVRVETMVGAPPERCFDLARSVEAHVASTGKTGERVAGGRAAGLMEMGEEVTWEGRHFFVRQRFTSRITGFERPGWFRDEMVRGAFRSFEHEHFFEEAGGVRAASPSRGDGVTGTRMVDVLVFSAPLGVVGWIAERVVLGWYLRRFLEERARVLKELAEGEGWRAFAGG